MKEEDSVRVPLVLRQCGYLYYKIHTRVASNRRFTGLHAATMKLRRRGRDVNLSRDHEAFTGSGIFHHVTGDRCVVEELRCTARGRME